MSKDQVRMLLKYIDAKFKLLDNPNSYPLRKRVEELAFKLALYAED